MTHPEDPMYDDVLAAVSSLRSDVTPVDTDALRAARARLENHIDNASARPAVLALRPRRRQRSAPALRWKVAASVAAAAVVAGGAYALTDDGHGPASRAIGTGSPTSTGSSSTSTAPAVVRFVNASQVLDAAASAATRTPKLGAGQYLHVSSHSRDITTIEEPPDHGAYEFTENRGDTWTPATGTGYERDVNNIEVSYPTAEQRRFAEAAPGGIPRRELTWYEVGVDDTHTQVYPRYEKDPPMQACTDCGETSVWDAPEGYDFSRVSRDPATLRASLYAYATKTYRELVKYGKGDQFTVDDLAYDGVTTVVTRPDLAGDLRAALYRVAKTIPGIELIGSLANYDGTKGIAVGRVDTFHVQHDLIFTGNGSTYIGDRSVARKASREYGVKPGTLLGASAVTVDITGKPDVPRRAR